MLKHFLFTSVVIFITAFSLSAENIILRNGQVIKGRVLGHDSESVTISADGATKVIPKNTIHKVIFSTNSSEIQKYLLEKKKLSKQLKKLEETGEDDEDLSPEETIDDKQDLSQKVNLLEAKVDKLEKKISRLRQRISLLKSKIKTKKQQVQ